VERLQFIKWLRGNTAEKVKLDFQEAGTGD